MLFPKLLILLAFALTANARLSIPLTRSDNQISPRALPDLVDRASNEPGFTLEPEYHPLHGSFWYGSFDIGNSKNLSMVIDTGTVFIYIVTPGLYEPSSASVVLNQTKPRVWAINETRWMYFYQTEGNGCGNLALWQDGYEDTVSFQGLTTKHQRFSVANQVTIKGKNRASTLSPPYQGIVGFSNLPVAGALGPPFLQNLFQQGQIEEPRFGLAFGTSGKGQQVLGGVDSSLFEGALTEVPLHPDQWAIKTSSLTLNGEVVASNQSIFFDSGGPSIDGYVDVVGALFKRAGVQAVETETVCGKLLYGYYPCDRPPRIGFEIGGRNFDIEPEALRWKDDGANNCTAILIGRYKYPGGWTVGQPFMQGKYIDFHGRNRSMGFATLKDTANGGVKLD